MTDNSRIDFRFYYDGAYLEKRDVDCKNADLQKGSWVRIRQYDVYRKSEERYGKPVTVFQNKREGIPVQGFAFLGYYFYICHSFDDKSLKLLCKEDSQM